MISRSLALVMVVTALMTPACSKNDAAALLPQLEDDRDVASKEADKAKQRVGELRDEVRSLQDDLLAIRASTDEIATQTRKLASEEQSLVYQQSQYQTRYLEGVQKRAPGMALGDITLSARAYRNARVKSIDPWEVSIIHDNGVTKVAMADLSPDLQAKLGFNPTVGPKPVAAATTSPQGSAADTKDKPATGSALPPPSPTAAPMGALKPGTVLQEGGGLSASGKILHRVVVGQDGRASELVGDGATATSAGKIQGAGSPLPPGYKPIGSNFTGSALDREYQKKQAAGKH